MGGNTKLRVAAVQMRATAGRDTGLERACAMVTEAARGGAEVVCLPELFLSPYFCRTEDTRAFELAEPIPGPTTEALGALARAEGVVLIAPLFEKRTEGIYHNTAAILDSDGTLAGIYRKMHIPHDPGYYEKFYFTPGDLGFEATQTSRGRIGTLICWDQWFPEAARISALSGAGVIFFPSAIGWHPHEKEQFGAAQLDAWRTVQRAHAISNGVYVAAVNRVGLEGGEDEGAIEFWGGSFICDPHGVVLAEAPNDEEAVLYAEVDMAHLEGIRRDWPFFRDRRIDAYDRLLMRFLDEEP